VAVGSEGNHIQNENLCAKTGLTGRTALLPACSNVAPVRGPTGQNRAGSDCRQPAPRTRRVAGPLPGGLAGAAWPRDSDMEPARSTDPWRALWRPKAGVGESAGPGPRQALAAGDVARGAEVRASGGRAAGQARTDGA
jgi:hypothetical protein